MSGGGCGGWEASVAAMQARAMLQEAVVCGGSGQWAGEAAKHAAHVNMQSVDKVWQRVGR